MKQTTNGLMNELHTGLQQISQEADNKLRLTQKSLLHADAIIKRLKEWIQGYGFKDLEEEILFFKDIKPAFQKEFFYFEALYHIESRKPVSTEQSIKSYYEQRLAHINDYFELNRSFYLYYLSGDNHSDSVYFVRNAMPEPFLPVYTHDLDQSFSTAYSSKLAKIQACEQLSHYLNAIITGKELLREPEKKGPYWSAKDVDIVEAAAALYYSGSVNHGKGGFAKFVTQFATFFNVKINNVPRVIYGMTIRKKTPAPFLSAITDAFVKFLVDKNL